MDTRAFNDYFVVVHAASIKLKLKGIIQQTNARVNLPTLVNLDLGSAGAKY